MEIFIVDMVNDVTNSCKSVNTCMIIIYLLHDVIHWITGISYDNTCYMLGQCNDSSSLTNEKDHHYFLNSADVCW